MSQPNIRPMLPAEAEQVSNVIVASIRAGLPSRYAPDVVAGLVAGNDAAAVAGHAPKQLDYVYELAGRIVAMVGLKRNEIGHLFVHPEAGSQGIGRQLVNFAADEFRKAGYSDMIVLSSQNAVGFYQRFGFVAEGSGSFTVGDNLPLVYVKMRAKL
ncbi:MAG: GNAT family N-acetyltransferase [Phycisphaerae bacterium]|nr:GNAT family N-acetyltransferase [Phycisphaerae bacterium]